ncbi:hypothetical protein HG15A2_01430 [Adhaeretor mobilis]|uniref:DUF1772 domain-containing protein n=1 Tax=Adhaeretor mobilis TaxID=1930276 RepID=A0A517MPT6_9BACT|nr:hypothetical protein HG15A2_01430 [Adhaeretor mobilis]
MTEFAKWSFLLQIAATFAMVGLIWFVQIVHYPLFSRVGRDNFRRYEMDHQRLVAWVVAPVMLTELITAIILLWSRPLGISDISVWLGILLLAAIWLITYGVQVPQHATLVLAYDADVQRRLVKCNWFRTAAWSARGFLVLWMVCQVFSLVTLHPVTSKLTATALP